MDWGGFPADTVFYFDPPYYITSAAYNDGTKSPYHPQPYVISQSNHPAQPIGMKGWGITEETELLRILKHIDELGFKFILSNVLEHKEKKNELLTQWIEEHHYRVRLTKCRSVICSDIAP